ncbi:putative E3 ubiquitin-protein ligase UNKL [Clupea harengus]|uniref:E3 ubiquitin-protein ligase UNKL n=1 Tax=Clupea harengus TaxID=7950 RepID=A0A8M1KG18_CLUHA|nr:putative E3 ubiquitin-protein ligase UNKL [Clupea harengus]
MPPQRVLVLVCHYLTLAVGYSFPLDTNFVLANYKTEQCTKPPRLCRQGYACPHYHNSRDRRRNPRKFKYRSTPCPSVKHGDEWGEPSKCESSDHCQYCHSRTEQQFHPEIYKSTKCNDMKQTGYCPRGPFCAFAHVERIPLSEDTMASLLTSMQPRSHSKFGSPQCPECLVNEWAGTSASTSCNNGQAGNMQSYIFPAVNPLTSSITSSLASSVGSDSSSPTTLSTMNAKAAPFYPGSNTVESVLGSALDLNFTDVNVASLDRGLEDQENSGHDFTYQRILGGSAPVNIPGSLTRSSPLHSSSSLSASPLSSLSLSLQQCQAQALVVKLEKSQLGTPTSTQTLSSLNGGAGHIWDLLSGSFSPSPSPVFSSLASASADQRQLLLELDEAKRKIKQCEEAWHQIKQACHAWQKDAQEAKEQAKSAEVERQVAEQRRRDIEHQLKELQADFDTLCRSPSTPLLRSYGELDLLTLPKLLSMQKQLRNDLDLIDGVRQTRYQNV